MAMYAYRVARADGTVLDGQIEGDNEAAIRAKLEGQGLLIFKLNRRGSFGATSSKNVRVWGKLSLQEFLVFNQELLALVRAGLPVLRVWDLLIERARHSAFQEAIRTVRQDIRGGASASEALTKHPQYFSDLYIATLRAGEQSGNLAEVLQRYIAYLKLMIGLRQKVMKALAYPAFLVIVGVGVVAFLLTYVMPTFVAVYSESAKTLPVATQILIDVVGVLQAQLIPCAGGLVVVIIALRAWYRTPAGHFAVDRLLLRFPAIGQVFVKHYTIQLTRTLSTVLAGGTPLVDALQVARGAVSNQYVAAGLATAVEDIREGGTLAAALDRPKILPKLAVEMLSVGEETGSLEPMLRDVAEFYEGDLDTQLAQLTTWIEPALLLVMGFLVGGIVIVMYLPVFQMGGSIQ